MNAFTSLTVPEMLSAIHTGKVITESITIEGEYKNGARFTMVFRVRYDPERSNTERAIAAHFGSQARTFIELCVEQRWREARWLYDWNRKTA